MPRGCGLSEATKDAIWGLRAEGLSDREIGRRLGRSFASETVAGADAVATLASETRDAHPVPRVRGHVWGGTRAPLSRRPCPHGMPLAKSTLRPFRKV
jgi:hypothetical protein